MIYISDNIIYFPWMLILSFFLSNYGILAMQRSTWKRIFSVSDRVFDSPNVTVTCADTQKCVLSCHRTKYASSLTFHSATNTCLCFEEDKINSTNYSIQLGTVYFSIYTVEPQTITYNSVAETPCLELLTRGYANDGVYSMTTENDVTFNVLCNMSSGGWTILQTRSNNSENFGRTYQEYVDGFGSLYGEFWLGLEYMHIMTQQPREVKFDLLRDDGQWLLLQYSSFYIEGASAYYKLHVSGHVASDEMCTYTFTYNDGMEFHAYDRDRSNCAANRQGGWWFKGCTWLNINGGYGLRNTMSSMAEYCGQFNHFTATVMSIR